MRFFSPATCLLLGFLLALASCTAFAETIPSTYTPPAGSSGSSGYAIENTSGWFCGGGTKRDDPETACDYCSGQYVASRHAAESFTYATENGINVNGYKCRTAVELGDGLVANITPSGVGTCPDGMASAGTYTCSGSCPAGQELVNGVCTAGTYSCPSGYIISADQQSCTKIQCPAGDVASKGVYYGQTVTTPACYNGCAATYSGQAPWDSASGWIYIGQYKNTGQTCTEASNPPAADVPTPPESTDPPTTAEYDCVSKGMSYGSVNGVTVCVPSGTPDTPPMVESPQTKTENKPDGTTTETQTQDVQSGTNITRNTTVIVRDAQGNIVSQETSSITSTEGAFCEENPNSSVCAQSKTSGGGNCDTPPSSEGDAIQAAILRQQWEARCEIKKQNDFVGTPGEAGVFESKTTAIDAKKTELGNLIDQIRGEAAGLFTFSGAGTATLGCDAGVTTTQGFHVELCFSKYDDELQMIGAVLVFVSLVIAVFIMFS